MSTHKISIGTEAKNRFGALLKDALEEKQMSISRLRKALLEQHAVERTDNCLREYIKGTSPGDEPVPGICKILDIDINIANDAIIWDDITRKYGEERILQLTNKDPRFSPFETRVLRLTAQERASFLAQMDGVVNHRSKAARASG